jgi:glycosidase
VRGYHGYWPTHDSQVEPHFGTSADLERLVAVAHSFGIRVVAEYVLDHVHVNAALYEQHPDWFNADPMGPNGCLCEDQGMKCSWDTTCWFLDYLPTFDFDSVDARKHVIGQAVGLAESLQLDGYAIDSSQYVSPAWANDLDRRVESETTSTPNDFLLLAAGIEPDSEPDAAEGVDARADWSFREVVVGTMLLRSTDLATLDAALHDAEQDATNGLRPANVLGTLYHPRPIHFAQDPPVVGDPADRGIGLPPELAPVEEQAAYERLANGLTVLLTAPGMPVLYYGDEFGMPGTGDPDNRHFMTFEDHTPAQRWLRDRTRALIRVRNDHPALRRGTFEVLHVGTETIVYEAKVEGDTVVVAINRSDDARDALGFPDGAWVDLLSGDILSGGPPALPARSAVVAIPSD